MNKTLQNETGNVKILLVEDNPYDAELTLRELKRHSPSDKLVWLKDGESALDFFFGSSTDPTAPLDHSAGLVLLDLKLPKVDGHEVLRRLKADPRTQAIPVVMLTSSPQDADVALSYKLGVNSYIVKPVEFDKFTEAVGQVFRYWTLVNRVK